MASKDNLSISIKVKYNFICIQLILSHAYRYRLEQYCGKRERGKFARTRKICENEENLRQLNRQPRVVELNQVECVTYLKRAIYPSLVSFEVLLLSNAN